MLCIFVTFDQVVHRFRHASNDAVQELSYHEHILMIPEVTHYLLQLSKNLLDILIG